jgi:hypothetical protein
MDRCGHCEAAAETTVVLVSGSRNLELALCPDHLGQLVAAARPRPHLPLGRNSVGRRSVGRPAQPGRS